MNAAHYHLLLNHMPFWTTIFGIAILFWGMYSKNNTVKKMAMVMLVIAGISVLAVVESGESAEDIVENIAAISHDDIEAHEEAADLAKWLTLLVGIGGAIGFAMLHFGTKGTPQLLWGLLALGIIALVSLSYTGYLGGQIRHAEEINADALSVEQEQRETLSHEEE